MDEEGVFIVKCTSQVVVEFTYQQTKVNVSLDLKTTMGVSYGVTNTGKAKKCKSGGQYTITGAYCKDRSNLDHAFVHAEHGYGGFGFVFVYFHT